MTGLDQHGADLAEAARQAAILKALLDEVKKAYDRARQHADRALLGLHDTIGVKTIEVRLPGSAAVVAQITVQDTAASLRVDEDGLREYCLREHPDEVVTVPAQQQVRPSWRKALLARATVEPDGSVVDAQTGRILDFVEAVPAPTPSATTMTYKPHGRDAIAAGHRDGRLSLPELLARQAAS